MKQRLDKLIVSKLEKIMSPEVAEEIVSNYKGLLINLPYCGAYSYRSELIDWAGVYSNCVTVEELGYADSYINKRFSIRDIDKGYTWLDSKIYFMDTQHLTLERMQQIACKKWKLTPIEVLKLEYL